MEWILKNLPLLVFLWVVFSIIRTAIKARSAEAGEKPQGEDETEEQRRVREIRERIRRRIEERAGGQASDSKPRPVFPPDDFERSEPDVSPPVLPPRLPEGNLMKRARSELERRLPPEPPELVPPSRFESDDDELERQATLAEKLEALEETRRRAERRVAQRVAQRVAAAAVGAPARSSAARLRLMQDLRDPESLRRAFVLREVLGPPVGLR